MDEPEPEAELELIGTNFFQILSEECLFQIFYRIKDTYRHGGSAFHPKTLNQYKPVEWSSNSYKSLGRLCVCCKDFNTLLASRVTLSKTIYSLEQWYKRPWRKAMKRHHKKQDKQCNLNGFKISDVTPFGALIFLEELHLDHNQICDITPLSALVRLTKLLLYGNQISDITPLSALVNLQVLHLNNNRITDITPLSALVNLQTLGLGSNQISDITPLSALVNLQILYLYGKQISDITPLSALVNLQVLHLNNNRITDRTPLDNLKAGGCRIYW
eukprot:SAG11_NODE_7273_length_1167_cov_293.010300_1_plen_273_part_00